jgi:hypothetical protein
MVQIIALFFWAFMIFSLGEEGFTLNPTGQSCQISWKWFESAWTSTSSSSCPFVSLSRKFGATVKRLQSWSQKRVGHIISQLGLACEISHQLEIAQDNRPLSELEKWLLDQLEAHIVALSSL